MSENNMKHTENENTRMEDAADAFRKIEDGVVEGFEKMTDKFVEKLFAREGESVEEAKNRLRSNDTDEDR